MKLMRVTNPQVVLELIQEHFQPLAAETATLDLSLIHIWPLLISSDDRIEVNIQPAR